MLHDQLAARRVDEVAEAAVVERRICSVVRGCRARGGLAFAVAAGTVAGEGLMGIVKALFTMLGVPVLT